MLVESHLLLGGTESAVRQILLNGTRAVPSHTTHSGKLLSTAEHALGLVQPWIIRMSFHFPLPKDLNH